MDRLTRKQRQKNMRLIRSSGSVFEKSVQSSLRAAGIYFQKNYRHVPGKPDIARPGDKTAVFLHSDFWHGWRYPQWKDILLSDFWKNKLAKNRVRDRRITRTLRRRGWRVMVVWEHSFRNQPEETIEKIVSFLRG